MHCMNFNMQKLHTFAVCAVFNIKFHSLMFTISEKLLLYTDLRYENTVLKNNETFHSLAIVMIEKP